MVYRTAWYHLKNLYSKDLLGIIFSPPRNPRGATDPHEMKSTLAKFRRDKKEGKELTQGDQKKPSNLYQDGPFLPSEASKDLGDTLLAQITKDLFPLLHVYWKAVRVKGNFLPGSKNFSNLL